MELTELLYGTAGKAVSSICILVILLLMFMITVQLYMNRRKRAYVSLALSLVFVIAQYVLLFILELSHHYTLTTEYAIQLLEVLAFIWINLGIFQLYNPTRRRVKLTTYGLNLAVILLAGIHIYETSLGDSLIPGLSLADGKVLDMFLGILILAAFLFIRPFIGQTRKYMLSLGIFLVVQIFHMLNSYVLSEPNRVLQTLENYLPVFYFILLFLIVFNRIVELLQAVYKSSIMDGLTGVYNRAYIMNYAYRLTRLRQASVIFCDIDNFKRLNDTQGHQMGDEVLKSVARIMADTVGDSGKVGRYGGEEIIAVLSDTSKEALKIAEAIRKRVEAETPVTVSVGFSRYRDGITVHELMKQADEAMYVSKKTGKNKVTTYTTRIPKLLASLEGQ